MNIKKGLSIFISAVMVFSPIMSVHAYDTDGEKKVIESPAVSDNDISEDKAVITHEVPKVKASSGTCGDDLTWTLAEGGTLIISGTGDMTNYSYPSYAPWYNSSSNVRKVIIDDGVTSISSYAFEGYSNLMYVTIGDSVTSIGDYAFFGCSKLTSVTIPDSVTIIGDFAFFRCSSLETVTIGDSVTSIGQAAFFDCKSIENVFLFVSVNSITSLPNLVA